MSTYDNSESPRPTRVRHLVVFVSVLMSLLLYLDRYCLSFAQTYIKEDLGLTSAEISWVISAFFWSYALAQVPAGWLTDRYGARGTVALYILTWSIFTACTGLAGGLMSLVAMRLGFGIGQAGAYPACASLLSKWVPFWNRGTASAFVAVGGRVGGAIAPPLTAFLMLLFVPTNDSSLLRDRDLLPGQAAALCGKLAAHRDAPAERVRSLLTDSAQTFVEQVGMNETSMRGARQSLIDEEQSLRKDGDVAGADAKLAEAAAVVYNLDADGQSRLVAALNGVIERDDLYDATAFGRINLDYGGLKLLEKKQAGGELSPRETQRLNRLLLEAAFPAEIGKIYIAGWRPTMIFYGVAGMTIAAMFYVAFRNRPDLHARCNAAEQELIASGRPAGAPSSHGRAGAIPWMRLLRSGSLWLDSLTQVGTNIGWLFLVTYLAQYLSEVHQVEIVTRSLMAMTPLLGGIVGMLVGGPFTDFLVRRIGLRWGRSLPISVTRFFAAAMYVCCLWADDPWVMTALFALVAFFCDLGIAALWAFKQDVGGRFAGSILGWGNMWGNLAAAISPPLYIWVLTEHPTNAEWERLFLVCAGFFCLSGVAAMGINATIPIAPPDDEVS